MAVFRSKSNDNDTGKTVTAADEPAAYAAVSNSNSFSPNDKVPLEEADGLDIPVVGFMMVDLPPKSDDPRRPSR